MKENIEYYYNIDIYDLEEKEGRYHFKNDNYDFFFVFFNKSYEELLDIIKCVNKMNAINFKPHDIIKNINNSYITSISGKNFVLLKASNMFYKYDILDIDEFNKKLIVNNYNGPLYRNNWAELWMKKNDYFEYQISELGLNKEIVKSSFSYYLGLSENAISIVNVVNKKYNHDYVNFTISHRRIYYPNIKLNFLNPLSFIVDLRVRDVSEYIKAIFFSNDFIDDAFIELSSYLKISYLCPYECNMLWARLLYPTYYFDIYEDIMNKDSDEERLIKIIDKLDTYEKFLKKAYAELSKYATIEKVSWLIN